MSSLHARGLTLIEVVVSVFILGMLAAFMVPTYQLLLSQLQLSSAVTQVADFIRTAQQRTVTEQQTYGVTVVPNDDSVSLFREVGAVRTTITTLNLPTSIIIGTVSFSGNQFVKFTPSGAPTVSGNFTLQDTVRDRSRLIEVRPAGNVRSNANEN